MKFNDYYGKATQDRLAKLVDKNSVVANECINWNGSTDGNYLLACSNFTIKGETKKCVVNIRHFVFCKHNQDIDLSDGKRIINTCGNVKCINPDHMLLLPEGKSALVVKNMIRIIKFYKDNRHKYKSDRSMAKDMGISNVSLSLYLKAYRSEQEFWDNIMEIIKYEKDMDS